MTNLTPTPSFDPVVQLETSTLALGGPGGPMNQQAQSLLNRTEFLQERIDGIFDEAEGLLVTASGIAPVDKRSLGNWFGALLSGLGSSIVGFKQSGLDAIDRNVQDKLREMFVTPEDFGADATYSDLVDDSPFVIKAIATGRPVLLQRYYRSAGVKIEAVHPQVVIGNGNGVSGLVFEGMSGYAGDDCLSVVFGPNSGFRKTTRITNFDMVAKGNNANGAIVTPAGGTTWGDHAPTYVVEGINFLGGNELDLFGLYDFGFKDVVRMGESVGSTVRDCRVFGHYDYRLDPSGQNIEASAFRFDATETSTGGGGVLLPTVDHCFGIYQGTAVACGYLVSNPIISSSQFHRNYRGVYSPHHAGDNVGLKYGSDEMQVIACNINSQSSGIFHAPGGFLTITSTRTSRSAGGFDHAGAWYGIYADGLTNLELVNTRAAQFGVYTGTKMGYYLNNNRVLTINGAYCRSDNVAGLDFGLVVDEPQTVWLTGVRFNGGITNGLQFRRAVITTSNINMAGIIPDSGTGTLLSFVGTVTRADINWLGVYNRLNGMDATSLVINTAGTTNHTANVDKQVKRYTFDTAAAYTHNLNFLRAGAKEGDYFIVSFSQHNVGPTVVIQDNGNNLFSNPPPASLTRYELTIGMTAGNVWRIIGLKVSLA